MNPLAQQVELLSRSICRPSTNPGAEIAKRKAEAKKDAIYVIITKYGPIGETEIAERSGLERSSVHHLLIDMERARRIRRESDKPRAPWVVFQAITGRLITFETEEDKE